MVYFVELMGSILEVVLDTKIGGWLPCHLLDKLFAHLVTAHMNQAK